MSVSATGATPYASVTDFETRCDVRTAGQLLSDTTVAMTPAQVAASPVLTALLAEASGVVEAAVTVAGVYAINLQASPPINDLATVQKAGGNSAALLAGLVCRLALWLLWERRPAFRSDVKLPAQAQWALDVLADLQSGKKIFGILEHQTAGTLGLTIDRPIDVENRRLPTFTADRYFGRRNNRYPQRP